MKFRTKGHEQPPLHVQSTTRQREVKAQSTPWKAIGHAIIFTSGDFTNPIGIVK